MQFIDCCIFPPRRRGMLTKTMMVMKLTAIFLLAVCLQVSAAGFSQVVTLSFRNAPLERVLKEVKKQTGYSFVYTRELLEEAKGVTINTTGVPLQEALERCFKGTPLTFVIQDKFIIIKSRPVAPPVLPKVIDTVRPGVVDGKVKLQGRVLDGADPLGGATITIRKPGQASVSGTTDVNGYFRVTSLADGVYTLEVSYIGFEKTIREVTITGKQPSIVLFILKKATSTLDAIQTTAYSKTTLRFNTGDISTVNSEEIARNPVYNVLQALEGRVAGMQVTQQTGKANGGFSVQIRSLSTLSAGGAVPTLTFTTGGQPLYIIDGVEYPASGILPLNTFNGFLPQLGGNALNYLDPSLIESINVLKGADATAVYGSRGAFGVILITTKKGKAGKPSLAISASQGISTLGRAPKLLDLPGYLALRREAFANDSVKPGASDYDVNGVWDTTQSTDWKKFYLSGHASTTRVNASYSGGTANSNYLLGANFSSIGNIERNQGVVRQGGMNFSINTASNDRKFIMALSGTYSTQLDNTVPVDFANSAIYQAPDAPKPFLPDGKVNWVNNPSNPAALLNAIYNNNTDNLIASTSLTFTPIEGLSFTAVGGFNLLSAKEFSGKPTAMFNPATFTAGQRLGAINQYKIRTLTADPRAEYVHTWGKARIDVIVSGSIRDRVDQQTNIIGTGFASDELLLNPTNANTPPNTSYNSTPTRNIAGVAVVNFRWADKYILDLNGRRDGSSVFGNNRQFGNFGSVAGGWIISEEPWFKGIRRVVDFLKVKASYGLVGGSAISAYQYIDTYNAYSGGYGGGLTLTPQNLSNPYLHWETDHNLEMGLNVDLFRGRLNIEAIYFTNKAGDQLTNQPLASLTGFTSYTVNTQAQIRSYGTELTVNTKNIQTTNFSWTSRILLTIPRTKLLAFPGLGNAVNNNNYVIGKPITGYKVLKYAGVDPATGYYNFYNAAGKKGSYLSFYGSNTLSNSDRTEFVDFAPKWHGSVLNTLSYKSFSMDFLILLMDKIGPSYLAFPVQSLGISNTNVPADIAALRWRKPGDQASVMRATQGIYGYLGQNNFRNSTGAFSDASYGRLQNVSFSYRLPARLVRKAGMSAFSVYVAGQNLFTVSKYKGLDPESLIQRIPPLRVFTGGLTVGF